VYKIFGRLKGGVTPAALKSGMASAFGMNLTDAETQALFDRFDSNRTLTSPFLLVYLFIFVVFAARIAGDGIISVAEFVAKCRPSDFPTQVRLLQRVATPCGCFHHEFVVYSVGMLLGNARMRSTMLARKGMIDDQALALLCCRCVIPPLRVPSSYNPLLDKPPSSLAPVVLTDDQVIQQLRVRLSSFALVYPDPGRLLWYSNTGKG
jgi:hypothetical protein